MKLRATLKHPVLRNRWLWAIVIWVVIVGPAYAAHLIWNWPGP